MAKEPGTQSQITVNKSSASKQVKLPAKNILVPPPPPVAANSTMMVGPMSFKYSEFAGVMNEAEARRALKRLETQLERTRTEVDEFQSQMEDHKNKSEKFQELFNEGVISRREMEASKREAEVMTRDMKVKMEELDELQYQFKRISSLLPAKKPAGRSAANSEKHKN